MFVEFKNKQGKRISYHVNSILFVGECIVKVSVKSKSLQRLPDRYGNNFEKVEKLKTSVALRDGRFQESPEEYSVISDKVKEALKFEILPKDSFIELKTRKKEPALCNILNFFSILETEDGVSIIYNDGIEQEYLIDYERLMYRIAKRYKIQEKK